MAEFRMKIAGHTAQVSSLFESTRDYCKDYLTEDEPEFTVTVTAENLAFEQADLLAEAIAEGMKPRKFTDPFLDRAAIQRAFAEYLFSRNILLFHGSTVALDGSAYLFTARCGTGKSTHTRLWRQVFGDQAVMVNDDKPFLELTASGVIAHGSPWSGKHGLSENISVPLKGICILHRGPENKITPISPKEAMEMLLAQGCCPRESQEKFLELIQALGSTVPLWSMECTKDPEAAQVSHAAMSNA